MDLAVYLRINIRPRVTSNLIICPKKINEKFLQEVWSSSTNIDSDL